MATSTFNHSSLHAIKIAFCNVIRILWCIVVKRIAAIFLITVKLYSLKWQYDQKKLAIFVA